jgi:hypothetical protein
VSRLYETQFLYDKRKVGYQFLNAQNEMRYNKEKPDINKDSMSMNSKLKNRQPLYKRTKDLLDVRNSQLENKISKNEELRQKEEIEWQQVQDQRVDKNYKDRKCTSSEWERTYDWRFRRYLKDKTKNIEDLDQRYNTPNQAVPNVTYRTTRGAVEKVENRVDDDLRNKKMKIDKLRRDMTPTFKPRINKASRKILNKSTSIRSKIRDEQSNTRYNSINKISSFIRNKSYDKDNIRGFVKDYNKNDKKLFYSNKNTDGNSSKQRDISITKGQTDGTLDSIGYGNKPNQDEFRMFLDNYESNISKAILIEEKLNLDFNEDRDKYDSNHQKWDIRTAEFDGIDSCNEEFIPISSVNGHPKVTDYLVSSKIYGITEIDEGTQKPQVIETSAAQITEYLQQLSNELNSRIKQRGNCYKV